jgi:hypothetical protein
MAPIKPEDGKTGGGVGYPMVATALAGIELFGGLTSKETFNPHEGKKYFKEFWQLVYPHHAALGSPVYELARNGLAHQFLTAAIVVSKGASRENHLRRLGSGDHLKPQAP